jgi:hypothetical protein
MLVKSLIILLKFFCDINEIFPYSFQFAEIGTYQNINTNDLIKLNTCRYQNVG